MRSIGLTFIYLSVLTTGCGHRSMSPDYRDTASSVVSPILEATPEAIGLLAFLNDPSTTMEVLDQQVPLNQRTALNLIGRRNGSDQIAGTTDDNLFETVAEVGAVAWVGSSAMARLFAYTLDEGWVKLTDEVVGVWDDVTFTTTEMRRTLDFANKATYGCLDRELALDRRTASNIVAARPFETFGALVSVSYVGTSSLRKLKNSQGINCSDGLRGDFRHERQSL